MLGLGLEHVKVLEEFMYVILLRDMIAAIWEVAKFDTKVLGDKSEIGHVKLCM